MSSCGGDLRLDGYPALVNLTHGWLTISAPSSCRATSSYGSPYPSCTGRSSRPCRCSSSPLHIEFTHIRSPIIAGANSFASRAPVPASRLHAGRLGEPVLHVASTARPWPRHWPICLGSFISGDVARPRHCSSSWSFCPASSRPSTTSRSPVICSHSSCSRFCWLCSLRILCSPPGPHCGQRWEPFGVVCWSPWERCRHRGLREIGLTLHDFAAEIVRVGDNLKDFSYASEGLAALATPPNWGIAPQRIFSAFNQWFPFDDAYRFALRDEPWQDLSSRELTCAILGLKLLPLLVSAVAFGRQTGLLVTCSPEMPPILGRVRSFGRRTCARADLPKSRSSRC